MNTETHRQLANDIWSICNLLRRPYKRNEYCKVILPLTVLPHVPDAWIDHSKTRIGYEIPLNRRFYRYELAVIEAEIKTLEADIVCLLDEVMA